MNSKTKALQTKHFHNVKLAKIVVKNRWGYPEHIFVNGVRFNRSTWMRLLQEWQKSYPFSKFGAALRAVAVRYIRGTSCRALAKEYYVSWGTFQKLFHAFGIYRPQGGRQPSHHYTKEGEKL